MSCPQQPCTAAGDSRLWCPHGVGRLVLGRALSCRLPFFPASLCSHDVPEGGQLQGSASSDVPGLTCSGTRWSISLAVQGVHRALPQHHISGESVVLLSAFAVQHPCPCVGTGSARAGAVAALSLTTSLLSVIFPNSSATALQNLSPLVISWLPSAFELTAEPG